MNPKISYTDLTQRPPRSYHLRLGGFVGLPRMLDKGRATLEQKNGQYNYNSYTDQHLVRFLGFDPAALLTELAKGKGDGEILAWVLANSKNRPTPWEVEAWSAYLDKLGPDSSTEDLESFVKYIAQHSKTREDIRGWFDALDLDDYVSFGGKA